MSAQAPKAVSSGRFAVDTSSNAVDKGSQHCMQFALSCRQLAENEDTRSRSTFF